MSKARPKPIGTPGLGRSRRPAASSRGEPRWAAWSSDLSRIIATGDTIEEARDAARALGEIEPALEPVQHRARLA